MRCMKVEVHEIRWRCFERNEMRGDGLGIGKGDTLNGLRREVKEQKREGKWTGLKIEKINFYHNPDVRVQRSVHVLTASSCKFLQTYRTLN